jgi:type IV pilus assembly protein PilA
MSNMRKAFTLVEILIVVAIVAILIALATPNILRSRLNANEVAARASLGTINKACQMYHINQEQYPASLADLAVPIADPAYIDSQLASGYKQGYEFIYELVDNDHFTVNANPTTTGLLKGRYFYIDESGIIRANSEGPAGPDDEIVR